MPFSAPFNTQIAAEQAGWTEVYDLYLKASIVTPWGTIDKLRLTPLPGGISFFTPQVSPEPSGTRGNAQIYEHWPIKREIVKGSAKSSADKLVIAASNVSQEWAQMLQRVSWYDTPVVIRKVPLDLAGVTAADCAILFIGQVDSLQVRLEALQLICSNDLGGFTFLLPRQNMHRNCQAEWGDDICGALRFKGENFKSKTVGAASTTTIIKSADFTEDTGTAASYGTDEINALADGNIVASNVDTGFEAHKVKNSIGTGWRFISLSQWGNLIQGYYEIPDAQAGLKNSALTPWLHFDLGSAKSLKFWRLQQHTTGQDGLAQLILVFSSSAGDFSSDVVFERYAELPRASDSWLEIPVHAAASKRYWRICIRSQYGESVYRCGFKVVQAYTLSRNWWAAGLVKFKPDTTTVALRNVRRQVRVSYSGEVHVAALPVAPVNGDTFTVERWCPGHFNDCAERLNTDNFFGFDSLPYETIVR